MSTEQKTEVTVKIEGHKLFTITPYNARFVSRAKSMGGRFVEKYTSGRGKWSFDVRDESRVRDLCREVYGSDGQVSIPTVSLLVVVGEGGLSLGGSDVTLGGRSLVRKFHRDRRPQYEAGVTLWEGPEFSECGGSMKYPAISSKNVRRVLCVRDVPAPLAEKLLMAEPLVYALLDGPAEHRKVLREERVTLLARLAEIDNLLGPEVLVDRESEPPAVASEAPVTAAHSAPNRCPAPDLCGDPGCNGTCGYA